MKNKLKIVVAFLLGIVISGITVYAAGIINSNDVSYNNTTVKEALDDLYRDVVPNMDVISDLNLTVSDITTVSMRVTVNSSLSDVLYVYAVNNNVVATTKDSNFLVENLDPETNYNIQVIAQDANGDIHMGKKKQATKDAIWLYKDGTEYDISGGFALHGYVGSDNYTLTKADTYMRMNVPSNKRATFAREENLIDFSEYNKVYVKYYASNGNPNSVFISARDNYNGYDNYGELGLGDTYGASGVHIAAFDVSSLNTNAYIYIRKTHAGYIDIQRIWLEK